MCMQAVYFVHHACGHADAVDLQSMPASKRARRAEFLTRLPCNQCSAVRSAASEREIRNAHAFKCASSFESSFGLLPFSGAASSIAHGAIARCSVLSQALSFFAVGGFDEVGYRVRVIRPARWILDSNWWIQSAQVNDPTGAEVEQRLAAFPFVLRPGLQ